LAVYEGGERKVRQQSTRPLEVDDQEPTAWLEDSTNLSETTLLQFTRQVVHHQAAEHDINTGIGERQSFDARDPIVNIETRALALPRATAIISADGSIPQTWPLGPTRIRAR